LDGGGLEEETGAGGAACVGQAAETELFEEFFEEAFQVKNVEFGCALGPAPEQGMALAGEGNGEAAFFADVTGR